MAHIFHTISYHFFICCSYFRDTKRCSPSPHLKQLWDYRLKSTCSDTLYEEIWNVLFRMPLSVLDYICSLHHERQTLGDVTPMLQWSRPCCVHCAVDISHKIYTRFMICGILLWLDPYPFYPYPPWFIYYHLLQTIITMPLKQHWQIWMNALHECIL